MVQAAGTHPPHSVPLPWRTIAILPVLGQMDSAPDPGSIPNRFKTGHRFAVGTALDSRQGPTNKTDPADGVTGRRPKEQSQSRPRRESPELPRGCCEGFALPLSTRRAGRSCSYERRTSDGGLAALGSTLKSTCSGLFHQPSIFMRRLLPLGHATRRRVWSGGRGYPC